MAYVQLDGHQFMLGDGETRVGSAADAGIRRLGAAEATRDIAVAVFLLPSRP